MLLRRLLEHYNDGRRKSFYCMAVNLLELSQLQVILQQLEREAGQHEASLKERAAAAAAFIAESCCGKRNYVKAT